MFVQAKNHHIYKANIEPAQSAQIASLEGILTFCSKQSVLTTTPTPPELEQWDHLPAEPCKA